MRSLLHGLAVASAAAGPVLILAAFLGLVYGSLAPAYAAALLLVGTPLVLAVTPPVALAAVASLDRPRTW